MAPAFIRVNSEEYESIFNEITTTHVRVTKDTKEVLDSFKREHVETDLYVVISFDQNLSPVYQIPIESTLDDAEHLDEAYCTQCSERRANALYCEVWFRSNKSNKTKIICTECAYNLMICKDRAIEQTPESKIARLLV